MRLRSVSITAILFIGATTLAACGGQTLATSWPNLSSDGEMLYVSNNVAVYAIDPLAGNLEWQFPTESDRDASQFYAEPTPTDELVFVSSFNQLAFALNKQGVAQWAFDGEPVQASTAPAATSAGTDTVYFVAGVTLHALESESGEERWQFESEEALWAPPTVTDERLYQPGMDHFIYALDAANGSVDWKVELGGAVASSPNLADGMLYSGTLSNHAYGINAESGRIKWDVETTGWVWSSPVVADGVAYFGDLRGTVYAVDAVTGRRQWSTELDSAVRGALAVAPGAAVFANTEDGFVYALDAATGDSLWQVELDPSTGERLLSAPVLTDGLVLITTLNGTALVYAYNQESGALEWRFNPGG